MVYMCVYVKEALALGGILLQPKLLLPHLSDSYCNDRLNLQAILPTDKVERHSFANIIMMLALVSGLLWHLKAAQIKSPLPPFRFPRSYHWGGWVAHLLRFFGGIIVDARHAEGVLVHTLRGAAVSSHQLVRPVGQRQLQLGPRQLHQPSPIKQESYNSQGAPGRLL